MGGSFSSKKQPVSEDETDQNKWVPEEIQYSIIPNLPSKSLLRFKCVSKSWNFMISYLNFIQKTPNLILCSMKSVFLMDYKEGSAKARRLPFPTKTEPGFVYIRACCNGILWIAVNEEEDILRNPLTRECKLMPIQPHLLRLREQRSYFYYRDIIRCQVYGFGYDHIRKDYQIIIIPECPAKPLVYSVAKDSFEILEDLIPHSFAMIYWNKIGISMKNGNAVYWPVLYYCDNKNTCVIRLNYDQPRGHRLILGFDFVNRRQILLPQPPGVNCDCNVKKIIDFKRSIWAIKNDEIESFIEMWLFKAELGKEKYWVKLI